MQRMFNKGMPKRHALQMEMTEWIYHLDEVQKTDVLSFLCAHVPKAVEDAKIAYEHMWAAAQEHDQEGD